MVNKRSRSFISLFDEMINIILRIPYSMLLNSLHCFMNLRW